MLLLANGRQRDDIAHGDPKKRSLVTWISVFFFPKDGCKSRGCFQALMDDDGQEVSFVFS